MKRQHRSYVIPLLGALILVSSLWSSLPSVAKEEDLGDERNSSLYQQEQKKEPAVEVKDELLIVWNTSSKKRQAQALSTLQEEPTFTESHSKDTPQVSLITLDSTTDSERVMKQLAENPDIRSVEPNKRIRISDVPNDSYYSKQWALPLMHVPEGWSLLAPSDNMVKVAVIDTGVDLHHPDLSAYILPGKDYIDQDDSPLDLHGHGTHVSGIIAAEANNAMGIAGLRGPANIQIIPLKIMGSDGTGEVAAEVQAIYDAVSMGADVINLSLGSSDYSQAERDAVRYATEHQVMVVAATGNAFSSVDYPAAYSDAVAVAATDSSDKVADFSNSGSQVDLAAPGVGIVSTVPTSLVSSGYASMTGTSMAAPQVSALAAVIKSQAPELTNKQIEQMMKDTASDIGTAGKDRKSGYGRIDFLAAISKLNESTESESLTYSLAKLQAEPATFHQLLASYGSLEITVRAVDGTIYTWQDLLKQSSTMSTLLNQDPAQITLTFQHAQNP